MKKTFIPLIFVIAGMSFVTYSYLDTFIIPKNTKAVSFNDSDFWDNSEATTSTKTSENTPNSSIPSIEGYYEDLSEEEIASLFTNEVVFREREHYSDSDIYIDITTHRDEMDTTTYYVADVRIKDLRYFKTALANDTFGENVNERTSDQCKKHHGILAMSGDNYGAQEAGYVLRNGVVLRESVSKNSGGVNPRSLAEDLAIYRDGSFAIFNEKETTLEEVANKGAWQVFSFGPGLMKNGEIAVSENSEVDSILKNGVTSKCQRVAIGIIAPLHYSFVVCDGRSNESQGFSLVQMANIMQELHCYIAYNMDGGGSATFYLDDGTGNANGLGHLINKPNQNYYQTGSATVQQRGVSDIVYIGKE